MSYSKIAKEYLSAIEKIDLQISNKEDEERECWNKATGTTVQYGVERVQASGNHKKMEDAVEEANEVHNEILALKAQKKSIVSTIELLKATEYDVLYKRYIRYMTYDEIGSSRRKTKSWATTVHGRALQNLGRILERRGV